MGIFVLSGLVAGLHAGNALPLSFVFAGVACLFAALCYAEFSAMIPLAGSAYTYCYMTLGEIWAWIIGWDLILEYGLAVSAVAIGWSGYLGALLRSIGLYLPPAFLNPPGTEGGIINLPAVGIVLCLSLLLYGGQKRAHEPMRLLWRSRLQSSSFSLYWASSLSIRRTGSPLCHPEDGLGSSRELRSSSLPSPGLTRWSRLRRKPKIPEKACLSASSVRLRSASSSISCSASFSPASYRLQNLPGTMLSMRRSPLRWGGSVFPGEHLSSRSVRSAA